jgi:hypothetical protein
MPFVVRAPSHGAIRIEDPAGRPVPLIPVLQLPMLGLCGLPLFLVAPASPPAPGAPYRLVPVFGPTPGLDPPAGLPGWPFEVTEQPVRLLTADLTLMISAFEHEPVIPSGSVCADPKIDGRPFSKRVLVTVSVRPAVDLIVSAGVSDPATGEIADSTYVPAVGAREDEALIELPLYDDLDPSVRVTVWDRAGVLLFAETLPPSLEEPRTRVSQVIVSAIDLPPPLARASGCQVVGALPPGEAASLILVGALLLLAARSPGGRAYCRRGGSARDSGERGTWGDRDWSSAVHRMQHLGRQRRQGDRPRGNEPRRRRDGR